MDEFPEDFNLVGMVALAESQAEQSHAAQPELIKILRKMIDEASRVSISRQNKLVRFGFNSLVNMLKKQEAVAPFIYLELESVHLIAEELVQRFPGRISALRSYQTADGLPRQSWVVVTEGKEFQPNEDCEIRFERPAAQRPDVLAPKLTVE